MREPANQPLPEHRDDPQLSTADLARTQSQPNPQPTNQAEAQAEADRRRWQAQQGKSDSDHRTPLFREQDASAFRSRWNDVQGQFVDDPRHAVEGADHLVAEAVQKLSQVFADERSKLEQQWSGGGDVSTEDLRLALQRYRSFFDRLLAA